MSQQTACSAGPVWRRAAKCAVRGALERTPIRRRLFWRLPPGTGGVALTFDDGPDPELTPRILDLLSAYQVPATFFLIGERAAQYPRLVTRILEEGHRVGNHTFSHACCRGLDLGSFSAELRSADEAICEAAGRSLVLPFRPPYGAITLAQAWHTVRTDRCLILWSLDTRDSMEVEAEEVAALGAGAAPRDVLVLHDDSAAGLEGLPHILESLRRRRVPVVDLPIGASQGRPALEALRHLGIWWAADLQATVGLAIESGAVFT